MSRLIDANEMLVDLVDSFNVSSPEFKNASGMEAALNAMIAIIKATPTHNPWRKIDDVEGLTEAESVLLIGYKFPTVGVFFKDVLGVEEKERFPNGTIKVFSENEIGFEFAVDKEYTDWMQIPEVPE